MNLFWEGQKTFLEKEKMMVIFSFSYNVFQRLVPTDYRVGTNCVGNGLKTVKENEKCS